MTGGFEPVRTIEDLESLSLDDIVEGYQSAERGDPEPGPNRGRAFWHGWRNRMIDLGVIPGDDASRALAAAAAGRWAKPRLDPDLKPGQWAFDAADLPDRFRLEHPNAPRVTVVAGDLATAKRNLVEAMRARGFNLATVPEPAAFRPVTKRRGRAT